MNEAINKLSNFISNGQIASPTWCIYPFTHIATLTNGAVTPCCIANPYPNINLDSVNITDAFNHPEVQLVRKKMLDGELVPNCAVCTDAELHGIESHRISSNRTFKHMYNLDQTSFTSTKIDLANLITLDLRLGNTCNLQCIMCRPNESHKWYDDIVELSKHKLPDIVLQDITYKLDYNRNDYNWIHKKIFWDNIDSILPNIKELTFGGGEPFMLKEVKTLLQKAVNLGVSENIKLRFHTNGTYLTEQDFDLLNKFKVTELLFSIDGIDQTNYFLRYPADWNKIMTNFKISLSKGPKIQTLILCSLNSVSAFYLDELYYYFSSTVKINLNKILIGRVYNPRYLNPQTLDSKRKELIQTKLEKLKSQMPSVTGVITDNLNWILEDSDDLSTDLLAYINKLLTIRKIDAKILSSFIKV